ncbi:MAG: small-conductance mechanosensitive channel, partial [Candidatus Woesearchaeota archaeon]
LIIAYIIFAAADIIILRMLNKVSKKGGFAVVKNLQSAIYSALKIVLILIAFAYILSVWGVNITPFLTGLGIAGLAVALALQPVLANVFSGVAVVLDKTIQVGDVIFLDSVKGTIYKIGLRSTQVKTFDNEIFVVPNTKIADGIVQNIALPNEEARGSVPFGVAYGTDITKVQKIVLKEIKKIEHVLTEPAPAVRFMNMGDSALDFKAFFYVDSYKNRFVASEKIRTAIYNSLNKAKIEIPFPQVDVHMKKK